MKGRIPSRLTLLIIAILHTTVYGQTITPIMTLKPPVLTPGGYQFYGWDHDPVGDVNGDHFIDFVVTQTDPETAYLYFGGPSLKRVPDLIFNGENTDQVAGVGDVNHDGYADLLLGDGGLHYGKPNMDTAADVTLPGSFDPASGGDINGDGFADLILDKTLYLGGDPMNTVADFSVDKPHLNAIGDINGDGFDDIVATDSTFGCVQTIYATCTKGNGRAWLYLGGNSIDINPDVIWTGKERGDHLGKNGAKAAGDLNGDGIDDFMLSGRKFTYIFYGGANPQDTPDITLLPPISNSDIYTWNVTGNFDFNNDGFPDIAVSLRSSLMKELILVYFGGPAMDNVPDRSFSFEQLDKGIGQILSSGADVTGDGIDDLLVVASYADDYVGKVYLLAGTVEKKQQASYSISNNLPRAQASR